MLFMTFDTPYGALTYDPSNGLTMLHLPDQKSPIRVRGTFKRMLLTLAFDTVNNRRPKMSMN